MNTAGQSSLLADANRALGKGFAGRCIGRDNDDIALVYKQHAAKLPLHLPELLIKCRNSQDVVRAFEFVRSKSASFSVRSGGHCFADLSNRGDVIIDCGDLNGLEIDSERSVITGPGTLSGDAIASLVPNGFTLPVGGCPLVALGGLSMVGGFGLTGRLHSLLSDRLVAAQILLADGNLVDCDTNQHSDLLWAIAGAGPVGFGIVTELRFDAAPLYSGAAIAGQWPIEQAEDIFDLWQNFAPLADNAICMQISLIAPEDPDTPCFVRGYGVILDSSNDEEGGLESLLARMAAHFGPFSDQIDVVAKSAGDLALHACGAQTYEGEQAWLPSRPFTGTALLAQRSQFFEAPLPQPTIADLIKRLQVDRTSLQMREIECIPWGGNYAQSNDRSCFSHRQAHMLLRYNSLTGRNPTPEIRASMRNWTDDCCNILHAHANNRTYAGYAEQDLPNPMEAYFGQEAKTLTKIKKRYDPDNIFTGYVEK